MTIQTLGGHRNVSSQLVGNCSSDLCPLSMEPKWDNRRTEYHCADCGRSGSEQEMLKLSCEKQSLKGVL